MRQIDFDVVSGSAEGFSRRISFGLCPELLKLQYHWPVAGRQQIRLRPHSPADCIEMGAPHRLGNFAADPTDDSPRATRKECSVCVDVLRGDCRMPQALGAILKL